MVLLSESDSSVIINVWQTTVTLLAQAEIPKYSRLERPSGLQILKQRVYSIWTDLTSRLGCFEHRCSRCGTRWCWRTRGGTSRRRTRTQWGPTATISITTNRRRLWWLWLMIMAWIIIIHNINMKRLTWFSTTTAWMMKLLSKFNCFDTCMHNTQWSDSYHDLKGNWAKFGSGKDMVPFSSQGSSLTVYAKKQNMN